MAFNVSKPSLKFQDYSYRFICINGVILEPIRKTRFLCRSASPPNHPHVRRLPPDT